MDRRPKPCVVIVADARMLGAVQDLVASHEYLASSTTVERDSTLAHLVERARRAVPPRAVVAVVDDPSRVDERLALGVDEVVVGASDPQALSDAVARALVRLAHRSRELCGRSASERILPRVTRTLEGALAALALDLDTLRMRAVLMDEVAALEDCASAVHAIGRLLQDVSFVGSCEGHEPSSPVSIGTIVDTVVRIVVAGYGSRVHVERANHAPMMVWASPRALGRSLSEVALLALEAVEATEASVRRLRIGTRIVQGVVQLTFEIGVGLERVDRATRRVVEDIGMLAPVRESLRAVGHDLLVEDLGSGIACTVSMPEHPPAFPSFGHTTILPPEPTPGRRRVLVVDSSDHGFRAVVRALGERYEVRGAVSGQDAVAAVREDCADVVLIDAELPDVATGQLIQELLRVQPSLAHRIILVVPAGPAMVASGVPVLEKPMRRATLLSTLQCMFSDAPRDSWPLATELN